MKLEIHVVVEHLRHKADIFESQASRSTALNFEMEALQYLAAAKALTDTALDLLQFEKNNEKTADKVAV